MGAGAAYGAPLGAGDAPAAPPDLLMGRPWPALLGVTFGVVVVTIVAVWIFLWRPDGPPDPLAIAGMGTFTCEDGNVVATEMDGTVHRWESWEARGALATLLRGNIDLPPDIDPQPIVDWLEACLAVD